MSATWYCLQMDVDGPASRLGEFWAGALRATWKPGDAPDDWGSLFGSDGVLMELGPVPEKKTVKHRVHLDVHVGSLTEVTDLGATILHPQEETGFRWTVLQDPQGGGFCAFVRDEPPRDRLYEVVVDSADPESSARWWAERFGVEVGNDGEHTWWWIDGIAGMPFENLVFVPVPEAKTVKNRVHWDLHGDVDEFERAGARVLWEGPSWVTMADPEGNEFCVFPPT